MLEVHYTTQFMKGSKRLPRKHCDLTQLKKVVDLIAEDSAESKAILCQHHNMHRLKGSWSGSNECHVANAGDWLVIWKTGNGLAVFQRTGTHDELFR